MPNRILKESICTSRSINRLTAEQETFFYRLIVNCDDHGYFEADPVILRSRLYPRRVESTSLDTVCLWLQALVREQMVVVFQSNGGFYLWLPSWDNHQQVRAKWHKYPEFVDGCIPLTADEITCQHLISDDINGNHLPAYVPVIQSNPILIQSNPCRQPRPSRRCVSFPGFDQFWATYPKKRSKGQAERAFSKLAPDEQLLATMLAMIERAKKSEGWTKENGRYIPHPATWLNAKGWEDDIKEQGESEYTGR
jgi:hypothetical protein